MSIAFDLETYKAPDERAALRAGLGLDWICAAWPDTQPKDFCGEHQPIPKD